MFDVKSAFISFEWVKRDDIARPLSLSVYFLFQLTSKPDSRFQLQNLYEYD